MLFLFIFFFLNTTLIAQKRKCYEDQGSHFQTRILVFKKSVFIEKVSSFTTFNLIGKIKQKRIQYAIDSTYQICVDIFSKKTKNNPDSTIVDIEFINENVLIFTGKNIFINRNLSDEKLLLFLQFHIKNDDLVPVSDFKKIKKDNKVLYRYASNFQSIKNIHGKESNKNHNYFHAKIYVANIQLQEGMETSKTDRLEIKGKEATFWNSALKKNIHLKRCPCSDTIYTLFDDTNHLIP